MHLVERPAPAAAPTEFPAIGVTEASVRLPQFLSQPFLVGDRVEVATGTGAKVLTGVVERIDPMRTIVRSDVDVPITIPNKASRLTPCAFPSPSHTPLSIAESTHSPVPTGRAITGVHLQPAGNLICVRALLTIRKGTLGRAVFTRWVGGQNVGRLCTDTHGHWQRFAGGAASERLIACHCERPPRLNFQVMATLPHLRLLSVKEHKCTHHG